jgi:SAM-dependent methyltransferase
MGYGRDSLNLTLSLWKNGLFEGLESVAELGSQDLKMPQGELELVFNKLLSLPAGVDKPYTPEVLYKGMGFKRYNCIDADGRNNALVFDLNKDIVAEYGPQAKFDLVTNHGTSEHCFDQYNVFRNVHNLCTTGGIMIHGLPFQGYLNHGFFNYQPLFYKALAAANNYNLLGLYLNINSEAGDISTYSDALMNYLSTPPNSTMLLLAVMQKVDDQEFRTPFDGKYISSSLLEGQADTKFVRTPTSFFLPTPFDIVNSVGSKQMAKLLLGRSVGKFKRMCASLRFWRR